MSGYVAKWLADIGDRVKKDQVLAIIDTPELDSQLDAARAQLKASEAEVKVRAADAEFAKTTYERWQGSPKGVVSEQEREDKKARFVSSGAQLNAAQARVNLDQANVDRLTFMTRFKQVTAPYEGVITERRVDIGDLVTAGSTASTSPLFAMAQYERIRVFTNVPQSASIEVPVGTVAHITANEYPNRVFEGKVARTSQSIDPRARTIRIEVDLVNADLALLPGCTSRSNSGCSRRPSCKYLPVRWCSAPPARKSRSSTPAATSGFRTSVSRATTATLSKSPPGSRPTIALR